MDTIIHTDREEKEPVKLPDEAVLVLGKHLERELAEALWAEKAFSSTLDQFLSVANDAALKDELAHSKRVVEQLIVDLNSIFHVLGEAPAERKCEAMRTHLQAGGEAVNEAAAGFDRDIVITVVLQKSLHYNIGVFLMLLMLSEKLGLTGAAATFRPTLEDKRTASVRLQKVTETLVANMEHDA